MVGQAMAVSAPVSLGIVDCMALAVSAVLMAVSIFWPSHSRRRAA